MPEKKRKLAAPMSAEEFDRIVRNSGMKVKDVAEVLGVTRQSIYDWRKGNIAITRITAAAVRAVLGE